MTRRAFHAYVAYVQRFDRGGKMRLDTPAIMFHARPGRLRPRIDAVCQWDTEFSTGYECYRLVWRRGRVEWQKYTGVLWRWRVVRTGFEAIDRFEAETQQPFLEEMDLEILL